MPALSIVSPGIAQPVRGSAPKSAAARGLRALLRDKTKAAHARLDSAISIVELRSALHYGRFLEAQAEALLPLEAILAASGVRRLFPDWERRVRSPALLEDIARLGGAAPPFDLPEPIDDAGMLGAMYVLEGSRLGSAVLLEAVLQSPDPMVRDATAYLSHGAQERLWPSFLIALECHGATLDDTTGAVASAHRAFALFEAGLSRIANPAAATMAATGRP